MVNGEVFSTPDQKMNHVFFILTESRGNREEEQDTVIKHIHTRGEAQDHASLTTGENKEKKSSRCVIVKERVSSIQLCVRCSNERLASHVANEQMNTISAVTMLLEAGSAPFVPVTKEGDLSHIEQAHYDMRDTPFTGITENFADLMLAATHLFCTQYMGLTNKLGVYLTEINQPTMACIEWIFMVLKQHVSCMFHEKCQKNHMSRLKSVYENRAAAFTAWCKMTHYLIQCPDIDKAVSCAISSFQCDAIALTDVVGMLWSMTRRCLHWGPILYSSCFIRECKMPIVPIDSLVELLSMQTPPDEESGLYKHYASIRKWLMDCVTQNRFVPLESSDHYFTEYISSSGLADGTIECNGVLRVNLPFNAWKEPEKRTAQLALAAVIFEK